MEKDKITKNDIKEIVNGAIENFASIVSQGFTQQAKLFDIKIDRVKTSLMEEIILSNDKIAKEFKDMRSENVAFNAGKERIDNKLLNHEDRIIGLEDYTGLKPTKNPASI